jgi:hypothetical protein
MVVFRCIGVLSNVLLLYFSDSILDCDGFVLLRPPKAHRTDLHHAASIVDVEFEPMKDDRESANDEDMTSYSAKSLFDLSLESDRDFSETRIPFIDTTIVTKSRNNYIDMKLAFMVSLDDAEYGIGLPFDTPVAITYENEQQSIEYISPDTDNEDILELMAIMATQIHEQMGPDLTLQHTPRILTISGPMQKYTKDWQTKLVPRPIEASVLLETIRNSSSVVSTDDSTVPDNDGEDGLAFFHDFMKRELGAEEYEKTLNEEVSEETLKELLPFFELPEIDHDGDALLAPESDFENAKESLGIRENLEHDGVALKLISYIFANGKSYSLVQLLKPFAIVGKYILENGEGSFELLSPEEEQIILPRLEEVCQQDLLKANIRFKQAPTTLSQ